MRNLLFTVLAASTLCACSQPPDLDVLPFGPSLAGGYTGKTASDVARAAGMSMPVEYRSIKLPPPTSDTSQAYGLTSWNSYVYHFENGTLGPLRGANVTDLFQFQASYGPQASKYNGICAPTTVQLEQGDYMSVLSAGSRLGLWQNSCQWALVVLPVPNVGHN